MSDDFYDSDNGEKAKSPNRFKSDYNIRKTNGIRRSSYSSDNSSLSSSDSDTERNFTPTPRPENHKNESVKKKTKLPEKLTVHIPKEESSADGNESSGSMTDVSPLQSANTSRRGSIKQQKARKVHINKTKETVIDSNDENSVNRKKQVRARCSRGEALSVHDLFYASDSHSLSSSEKDVRMETRKKVLRKKKISHDELRQRMDASTRHHRRRLLDVAAQNSMDISQLLEVVLEMEQEEKMRKEIQSGHHIPRHYGHAPMRAPRKKNMSFTNQQVRDIDTENQRLLRRLTQLCVNPKPSRPSSASSVRSTASSCRTNSTCTSRGSRRPATAMSKRATQQGPRLYHSATNRIRDQQRIERENLAFLKRLQAAKASTSLRRDTLLHDYERQTGKAVDSRPKRRSNQKKSSGYAAQIKRNGRPEWQDSW